MGKYIKTWRRKKTNLGMFGVIPKLSGSKGTN